MMMVLVVKKEKMMVVVVVEMVVVSGRSIVMFLPVLIDYRTTISFYAT